MFSIDHSELMIVLLVSQSKNCCTVGRTPFFLIRIYAYSSYLMILVINVIQIVLNIQPTPSHSVSLSFIFKTAL